MKIINKTAAPQTKIPNNSISISQISMPRTKLHCTNNKKIYNKLWGLLKEAKIFTLIAFITIN
jgi:hypothetical protein